MKSNLAEILIQNIEFFALAPDSEISPDAAVRQLEIISTLLKDLPKNESDSFFAQVQTRLERLRKEGASQEQLNILENIREYVGL